MSDTASQSTRPLLRILYCRCAYAKVVPAETKDAVLNNLCAAGQAFDTVADLCEMSARRDPALKSIAQAAEQEGGVKIAACYPRAVRWLFAAADAKLPEAGVEIVNMRTETAQAVTDGLLAEPAHKEAAR
jgi:hypothetical protein